MSNPAGARDGEIILHKTLDDEFQADMRLDHKTTSSFVSTN